MLVQVRILLERPKLSAGGVMVATLALGASAFGRVGSSPTLCTIQKVRIAVECTGLENQKA